MLHSNPKAHIVQVAFAVYPSARNNRRKILRALLTECLRGRIAEQNSMFALNEITQSPQRDQGNSELIPDTTSDTNEIRWRSHCFS